MPHAYLLYLAIATERESRRSPEPCCTDTPRAIGTTSTTVPSRWARKLVRAVPASASTFRRTLRNPLQLTELSPGDAVVTPSGKNLGMVRDVYLARGSRRSAVAISPAGAPASTEVLLLPIDLVRRRSDGVVVVDDAVGRVA